MYEPSVMFNSIYLYSQRVNHSQSCSSHYLQDSTILSHQYEFQLVTIFPIVRKSSWNEIQIQDHGQFPFSTATDVRVKVH